jgi:O-antigen/teichoic acid export membrane protein
MWVTQRPAKLDEDILSQVNEKGAGGFSAGAWLCQPVLFSYLGPVFGSFLVPLIPISLFSRLVSSVLSGRKKNARAEAIGTTRKFSIYMFGSLSVIAGVEPTLALILGLLGGHMVELTTGLVFVDITPKGWPHSSELLRLFSRVRNLTVAGLGSLGQQWMDTLLIGAFLSPAAVAVYEVAWRLSAVGLIVTNGATSVLYPRFAEAAEANDDRLINHYAQRAFFYVGTPMVALTAGTLAIGPEVVSIVYGANYATAYLPLVVLFVGRFPYSLSRITTVLSYSYNLDRGVTRASISAALLNAAANAVLIPFVGIVGAALGSLLSYTVMAALLFRLISDRVDAPSPRQFFPSVGAAVVMLICIRPLATLLPGTLPMLGVRILTGIFVFVVVLLILSPIAKSDFRRTVSQIE